MRTLEEEGLAEKPASGTFCGWMMRWDEETWWLFCFVFFLIRNEPLPLQVGAQKEQVCEEE